MDVNWYSPTYNRQLSWSCIPHSRRYASYLRELPTFPQIFEKAEVRCHTPKDRFNSEDNAYHRSSRKAFFNPFNCWLLIVVFGFKQRIRAPLCGPETALPEFPDNDSWYYNVCIFYLLLIFLNCLASDCRCNSFLTRGRIASLNSPADRSISLPVVGSMPHKHRLLRTMFRRTPTIAHWYCNKMFPNLRIIPTFPSLSPNVRNHGLSSWCYYPRPTCSITASTLPLLKSSK
jgi:hypothetical protein